MPYDYDLIVLGGGAGGLTSAGIGAFAGARTAIIEQHRLGGDCTWTGCIPSKTLLHAANIAQFVSVPGVSVQQPVVDWTELIEHLHQVRKNIYEDNDSPEILAGYGIDVLTGRAAFKDSHTVIINQQHRISARYIIIATGAHTSIPPIPGLSEVAYLTNESIFEQRTLPRQLAIIGAGPQGLELGQALKRLGSQVTILENAPRALNHMDEESTKLLQESLRGEGLVIKTDANVSKVTQVDDEIQICYDIKGRSHLLETDALILATGRTPNFKSLNLDAAGVRYNSRGISVSASCRTSTRHIYAVGDVTGLYGTTHMAEHMAHIAAGRALLKLPRRLDTKRVPVVVFTDPELACIGPTEADLQAAGTRFDTQRFPYNHLDRAIVDEAPTGLIKVFTARRSGKILGVTVLGARAGELICEYALALRTGATMRQILQTIHPYPTYGLGVRRVADQWMLRHITESRVRWIQRIFGYKGSPVKTPPGTVI